MIFVHTIAMLCLECSEEPIKAPVPNWDMHTKVRNVCRIALPISRLKIHKN